MYYSGFYKKPTRSKIRQQEFVVVITCFLFVQFLTWTTSYRSNAEITADHSDLNNKDLLPPEEPTVLRFYQFMRSMLGTATKENIDLTDAQLFSRYRRRLFVSCDEDSDNTASVRNEYLQNQPSNPWRYCMCSRLFINESQRSQEILTFP